MYYFYGQEAVELFRQHQPDITLIDLRMPELSGVEAIASSAFFSPRHYLNLHKIDNKL
ncbi:hypothetical protein [uncultured Nostoc sp.]|uniref:hypothetical protein n=1 Tax=uncultured Nostoc sp. TaxID=340711 RepID=UPI0035CB45A2